MKKPRSIENDDYCQIIARFHRAYLRRLSETKDVDDLVAAHKLSKDFQRQLKLTARALFDAGECTGTRAAEALGMTKQGFLNLRKREAAKGSPRPKVSATPNQLEIL